MEDFIGVLSHDIRDTSLEDLNIKHQLTLVMNSEENNHFGCLVAVKYDREQLFTSDDGRYTIALAGKIYNVTELKQSLIELGYQFKTNHPCEVLWILFSTKGVTCFRELQGMYAILILDHVEQKLYGARDPFGMKQLYYYDHEQIFILSTAKEDLLNVCGQRELNMSALQQYLTFQYVPDPQTIDKDIFKVKPGHFIVKELKKEVESVPFFHVHFQPQRKSRSKLLLEVREALIDSVAQHVRNEKSIGSFLSGGIDSSIIAAIAKQFVPNLKTFSVAFDVDGYSELDEAKKTAEWLGLDNISYVITADQYVKELPKIMKHLPDPFADPSCVPLYFAASLAQNHVNTVLSGEGADELFGGYHIYREYQSLMIFKFLPTFMKQMLYKLAEMIPDGIKGKSFLKRGTTPLKDRYVGNAKIFEEQEKIKLFKKYCPTIHFQGITKDLYHMIDHDHPVQQMQFIDLHTWLPGNILYKAYAMSRAHHLEVRMPFLSEKVYEVARKIPVQDKITKGTTKYILREAFRGYLPEEALYRKKLGFPVPIAQWLKTDLYDWARTLITTSETDDMFNKQHLLTLLDHHALNKKDYGRKIWTVLMFMLWHQVHMEQEVDYIQIQQTE